MTPRSLFLDHPDAVGESYAEHCGHALSFSAGLFVGAFACVVHAFIPALCESTASRAIDRLHSRMTARREASLSIAKVAFAS